METSIIESRLWKCPRIGFNILRHPTQQAIDTLLWNESVFLRVVDGEIASYCAVSRRKDHRHLMAVFTFQKFRGKGHATSLVREVLERSPQPVYLICRAELEQFYNSIGFVKAMEMPLHLQRRRNLLNVVLRYFPAHIRIVMVTPS